MFQDKTSCHFCINYSLEQYTVLSNKLQIYITCHFLKLMSNIKVTPAVQELLSNHIEKDKSFKSKKELLNMMYCEQMFLDKCDKYQLLKIHYYVTHTESPLKQRCLELLDAHYNKKKIKIRHINMATIQKEIALNQQVEKQQRQELLQPVSPDTIPLQDTNRELLLQEEDMDIEALEEMAKNLEDQVHIQMKGMSSELKESSLRFNQILQKDDTTIHDTWSLMTANESTLTTEQLKLKQLHSSSWTTLCYTILLFIFVLICFIVTYLIIRTFPNSNTPRLLSFIGDALYSMWLIIFPQETSLETNEEL